MKTPTYNDVYQFAKQVQGVSQQARADFLMAVDNIDFDDWPSAAQQLRTSVYSIVDYYGLASSELGAQWYEYCRSMKIGSGYTAIVGQTSRYNVKSDCNVVIDKLFSGEISQDELIEQLSGVVVDQVQKQSRDTILENLGNERLAAIARGDYSMADSCGYARVPVGDTCAFCMLLASRGFVYKSEKSATISKTTGDKYHKNCNCAAVPFHDAHSIKGYGKKLEKYESMYRDADNLRRSGDYPEDLRRRIDETKKRHNEDYAAGNTTEKWSALNETTVIMRYQNKGLS